ncbi:MAG: CDP-diacylglycerol--glycerol-3-phosphate 3-phosphatidyltransferase [Solobacterium sp.]|nr:CDP-diacylglycerol--glycerol-3-phosphate 3-phosphatidyltransferase [Solobacterium sp.]
MNLPNRLTLLRIVLVPVIILVYIFPYAQVGIEPRAFMVGQYSISSINLICLGIYFIAAITDLLDGQIARKYHLQTTFGKFADPIADKMLTTTMFVLFVSRGIIPVVPVIIMICRDIAVDGMRMVAANNGKVVSAQMMGKLKTVLQMVSIALILLNNLPFELWRLPVSDIVLWFAALISFASGLSYFNQLKEDILESK